ncbi:MULTISPECIES: FGGY-family carbohydrate kinase [unclassified Mesorhizobium]|uniref:FGGY-family carbohydrate kinase n=1 Tax=unclassified Mesorhizobium TaxID=325217 RepID=UPI0003CF3574|nr:MULTISPECIES: FGGY-family carbohydrate kinase [unclassified Mesorhizobium]ESW74141.1 L-xylulose kinase [Mesorhizobium sp. LSJC285A00]ESX16014.1 L-xylulose kinase [Mesorhizobium sp. LSJC255A00]ESX21338.1 L-xylulose kinase [Mesorhizobium sp. LSJC264A00]ESX29830.1 L-xylulose kinase [Mesorhizobium sp. LSHC440B00]ESX35244.1 L-xylulose kinase [Mesorhizobium sp. LSHC432A00]
MKDLLIGIDAGTSVIKSVAFDLSGRQLAMASVTNSFVTLEGGGAEQDLNQTWRDMVLTVLDLATKIPDLARRTAAVAVTGQGDGTWLIDGDGMPVGRAWLWLDARAGHLVDEMRGDPRDRTRFEITGTGLNACQQGAQLSWLKKNSPEILERAATAFHCKDWLYFKMTGERATDPSEGTFTFGDFRARSYSDEVLDILDLTSHRRLLPPMLEGTTDHHPLSASAAGETGLLAGTPVVLGYVDMVSTALGAGLYDPSGNVGCTVIGSTGIHTRLARTPDDVVLNDNASGYTIAMPVPGAYAQLQSNMAATLNIDWLLGLARDVLTASGAKPSRDELLKALDVWVEGSEPGSLVYQPYISLAGERGPFVDPDARAGFIGLSVKHGFGDLARAVLEGLAFAARDCYQAMGSMPSEIRLSGGAARSPSLRRIIAAATRAQVRTSSRQEAGAAGAAMMAAVGLGFYRSMDDCCAEWVTPLLGECDAYDEALSQTYDALFPSFVAARQALHPVWKSMAHRTGAKS